MPDSNSKDIDKLSLVLSIVIASLAALPIWTLFSLLPKSQMVNSITSFEGTIIGIIIMIIVNISSSITFLVGLDKNNWKIILCGLALTIGVVAIGCFIGLSFMIGVIGAQFRYLGIETTVVTMYPENTMVILFITNYLRNLPSGIVSEGLRLIVTPIMCVIFAVLIIYRRPEFERYKSKYRYRRTSFPPEVKDIFDSMFSKFKVRSSTEFYGEKKTEGPKKVRVRYTVPEKCPQCKALLNLKNVIWLGPMDAKCPYCDAGIRAEEVEI